MNILHLWKSDSGAFGGGGAISMSRLHESLREAGVDSNVLCQVKTTQSPYVQVLQPSLATKVAEKLLRQITSRAGLNDIHRISSFKIKEHKSYRETDVVHFHGMHSGFINYLALPVLTEKPAVFTLKDMWALTGHCGYTFDCDRWQTGCGKCPDLSINPAVKRDNTRLEWKLKDRIYRKTNLVLICPSQWIAQKAKQSPLTSRFPIHHIPHAVDIETFYPLDSEQCRLQLGLPLDKNILMFSAVAPGDYRKGGDLLLKALQNLPKSLKADTILLVIGKEAPSLTQTVETPVYHLGYLNDERKKAMAYSAADLSLFPTRADVFGLVSIESQACGTPVVSFNVGGVPEHVRTGITGYLAEPEDAEDFGMGITKLLEDKLLRQEMSQQCRRIVVQEYNSEQYALRHMELYRQLLGTSSKEDRSDTELVSDNELTGTQTVLSSS